MTKKNAASVNAAHQRFETKDAGSGLCVSVANGSTVIYFRQLAAQAIRRARLTRDPQRARKFHRLAAFLIREVLQ